MIRPACRRCSDARRASPSSDGTDSARRSVAGAALAGGRTSRWRACAPRPRPRRRCRSAPSSSGASAPARCCRWPASPPACSSSSPSSASSARSTIRRSAFIARWPADLVLVPPGFKSLQLHAEVPVAMTDIVSSQPLGRRHGAAVVRRHVDQPSPACRPPGGSPGMPSTSSGRRSTCRACAKTSTSCASRAASCSTANSRPYFGDLAESRRARARKCRSSARPTTASSCARCSLSARSRSAPTS